MSGKINGDIFVDPVPIFYYGRIKVALGFGPRKQRDTSIQSFFPGPDGIFQIALSLAGSLRKPDHLPPQGPLLVPEKGVQHDPWGICLSFGIGGASKLNSGDGKSYRLSGSSSTKAHTCTHTYMFSFLFYFMKVADYK